MLRAIIGGERDPQQLAQFRQPGRKHSEAEIAKPLTGKWDDAQLFVLEQSVALSDYYTLKIAECDSKLEQQYKADDEMGAQQAHLWRWGRHGACAAPALSGPVHLKLPSSWPSWRYQRRSPFSWMA
jgi:hypothetical protein